MRKSKQRRGIALATMLSSVTDETAAKMKQKFATVECEENLEGMNVDISKAKIDDVAMDVCHHPGSIPLSGSNNAPKMTSMLRSILISSVAAKFYDGVI